MTDAVGRLGCTTRLSGEPRLAENADAVAAGRSWPFCPTWWDLNGPAEDENVILAGQCRRGLLAPGRARVVLMGDCGRLGRCGRLGFEPGSGIVMRKNGVDRFALACTDDGAPLTQPDAVAVPLTRE